MCNREKAKLLAKSTPPPPQTGQPSSSSSTNTNNQRTPRGKKSSRLGTGQAQHVHVHGERVVVDGVVYEYEGEGGRRLRRLDGKP